MMVVILIVVTVLVTLAVRPGARRSAGNAGTIGRRARRERTPDPIDRPELDPVEALSRYGTPADGERLTEAGIDLAALGYDPSHDG